MPSPLDSAKSPHLPFPPADPSPHPIATVAAGRARFTVLTERLLRLEWSNDGRFDDRASFAFIHRRLEPPPFEVTREGVELSLSTDSLRLRFSEDGRAFHAGNLEIALRLDGQWRPWRPGDAPDGNLLSTRRDLDDTWLPVSLQPGILSRDGWALVDDTAGFRFGAGGAAAGWAEPALAAQPDGLTRIDWYFFGHGRDYAAALRDFVRLSGPPPMPPRYALGAWWSRYWPYSADDLMRLVETFREHGLPLDIVVVDMDWHTRHGWTGYTWDRALFPDPAAFFRWLHDRGLRATLNLHPHEGVQPHEDAYPAFARAMGVDPKEKQPIPFRLTDPRFAENYLKLLHRPLEEQGVDFWWIDWQQGRTSELPGLDPLAWLNHLHWRDLARPKATAETIPDPKSRIPHSAFRIPHFQKRPLLLSRWAGLGGQRYPVAFSGDVAATWPMLAYEVHYTGAAAGAGALLWSHDIGAHFAGDDPELFVRWVQFGALSPCLRLHGSRDERAERRPWAFGQEVLHVARAAFALRYRLIPYLYSMMREAAGGGLPLCRPMWLDAPDDGSAYLAEEQYLLGDRLLAAPIVSPIDPRTGLASSDVWLPPGVWIDSQTLESHVGPGWVRLVGGLERIPLLARAGAIVPMTPADAPNTDAIPRDRLRLDIYAGADGQWRHYEDDGETESWRQGEAEWTRIAFTWLRNTCALTIAPTEGRCPALPAERAWQVRFIGVREPGSIEVIIDGEVWREDGGSDYSTSYHAADVCFELILPPIGKARRITVTLTSKEPLWGLTAEWNLKLRREDVRRLLHRDHPELVDDDALVAPEWIAPLAGRHAADALARLGGPFPHVIEHTAAQRARRTLGRAVIVAPLDGSAFDARVVWTLHHGGRAERTEEGRVNCREDQMLAAPFNLGDVAGTAWWRLEIALDWGGRALGWTHRSMPLWPSIPLWRIAVCERNTPPSAATDAEGALVPDWDWEEFQLDHESVENAADWFRPHWPSAFWDHAEDERKPHVLAVARVVSPTARRARLRLGDTLSHFQPVRKALFTWNGCAIALAADAPEVEVEMAAGRNVLAGRIHLQSHQYLTVALTTPEGNPMTDLHYE
jgi:alpha-glucosidase